MSGRRAALAARRAAMGHTQESLAGLLCVERSTVTRWERGTSTPQPWVRRKLAGALSVTIEALDDLLTEYKPEREQGASPLGDSVGIVSESGSVPGRERSGSSVQSGIVRAQLPALRRVLDAHDLPEDGPVRPLGELSQVVLGVVRRRLDSDYSRLATELPSLLPELSRALLLRTGQCRAEIARLLAQTYRAADAIADKFGYYDLSARIIGLMGWAAAESGDELSIAAASYVRAETFFANGDLDTGRRMLERVADRLMPDSSIDAAAAYGALHMRAAVTAARDGRALSAGDHLAEARRFARRVPEGVYCGTAFGPASVRIHHVTLSVDLGDADAALRAALGWAPPVGLPAERRSHYYVDLARAQLQAGKQDQALASLIAARAIAPEHIHEHPDVRDALSSLLHASMARSSQALDFARWVGIPDFAP